MKGFSKLGTAAYLTGVLLLLSGCYRYGELVDRCYPSRYNWAAQQEVCEAFAPQVNNGHVLDQTIWNWMFDLRSANLNKSGIDQLQYIIRRRPHPDPCIYVATAHDVVYSPTAPSEVYIQDRAKLDRDRVESLQKFLAAETDGRGLVFQVMVHDPAEKYMYAEPAQRMISGQQGFIRAFVGSNAQGGGGGAGGGGQ